MTAPFAAPMTIRQYEDASDRHSVIALWNSVFGLQSGHNDPESSIDRKRAVRDGLFFVAVDDGIVGTVMAGYDGHRGWIYSLAVAASRQRERVGTMLLRSVEEVLAARGCVKVNLQVLSSNADVVAFYERHGYAVEPRISLGKRLPQN